MTLSDYERRVLGEIERSLIDDDPEFATSLGAERAKVLQPTASAVSTAGLLVGLCCMLVGAFAGGALGCLVAIAGFLVILSCR